MTHLETITTPASETRTVTVPAWREALRARPSGHTLFGEPLRRLVLVSLAFMTIAIALVFIAVARGPELSIVDEPAHASYMYSISHGSVPAPGSADPDEIKYEWYCHSYSSTSACTGYDASTFQPDAQDYTFGDPPVYYAITGYLDVAISPLVPGTHNFITVGRDLGALWLFLAMLVLYLAARRFRVDARYAFLAGALLPLCPGILASTSEVTSDAPAALCGALALYVLARITVEKRLGVWVPFLAAVLSTGTKVLNGMPILVVGGVCLSMGITQLYRSRGTGALRDRLRAVRAPFACAAAVFAGFALTYLGWNEFQEQRGDPNWVNPNLGNGNYLGGSPVGDFLSNLFSTFQHLTTNYWLQPEINGETIAIWATLLCVLFCAAPFVLMAVSRSHSSGWILGLATAIGIAAVAVVVEAQVYVANNEYFVSVAGRYALCFLPWAIVCLAIVAHRRRLLRTSSTLVSLGLVVMVLAETGLFALGPALTSNATLLVG